MPINILMMKKTMAILGDTGGFSPVFMEILVKLDIRLLFVSEDVAKNIKVKEQLESFRAAAEIEFISCEREGCWEADIIAVVRPENISPSLVDKIKEVATQKTVLVISEENKISKHPELEKLLPYSKVIEIELDTPAKQFSVSGKDVEALSGIKSIFENAGYQFKI